jgi:acyl-CoA thioesterase-1
MKSLILLLSALALAACSGTSPVIPADPQVAVKAQSDVVAFMGDSITQFWDLQTYTSRPVIDFGVAGQTTPEMLARFQNEVIVSAPGVVVILGGVNDFFQLGATGSNTDSIAQMAAMAKAAGIKVILCSLLPATYPIGTPPTLGQVRQFNDSLIQLAQANGYLYADYFDEFLLPDGTQNFSLYEDYGVHPNAAGYDVMWSVVGPLIQEYLP